MCMVTNLSALGLTLALSSAALAMPNGVLDKPIDRHAFLDRRGYANEPVLDCSRPKRHYWHNQERARNQVSCNIHLPRRRDPDGGAKARAECPSPWCRYILFLEARHDVEPWRSQKTQRRSDNMAPQPDNALTTGVS